MPMIKKNKSFSGFTLIELLVVITIIGILATVGLASFRSAQAKSRDARRKADLVNIQKALEMYLNDKDVYPSSSAGQIEIPDVGNLVWNAKAEFTDDKGTIYMKQLPNDPSSGKVYCYLSDGSYYKLYANLENVNDLQKLTNVVSCEGTNYNYGVSSSETLP